MSDRLSFETVQEPVVPEQNRLFVIIAIGLVGMLVLGLLGIGGYVIFARTKHASAVVSPPTVVAFIAAATPTVMATNTPMPTLAPAVAKPTNTPVVLAPTVAGGVSGGSSLIKPTATPQLLIRSTVVVATSAPSGPVIRGVVPTAQAPQPQQESTPNTGFGMGGFVGMGTVLAGLAFVARRLRLR
jgi:ABC-type Na+ efflux pump permease subunit